MTGCGYNTRTEELFKMTGMLSVNQLVAYTTLISIFKIKISGKPTNLAQRLGFHGQNDIVNNRRNNNVINLDFRLARGREGMLYRGAKLFNALDPSLQTESRIGKIKSQLKDWIALKISQIPHA